MKLKRLFFTMTALMMLLGASALGCGPGDTPERRTVPPEQPEQPPPERY